MWTPQDSARAQSYPMHTLPTDLNLLAHTEAMTTRATWSPPIYQTRSRASSLDPHNRHIVIVVFMNVIQLDS